MVVADHTANLSSDDYLRLPGLLEAIEYGLPKAREEEQAALKEQEEVAKELREGLGLDPAVVPVMVLPPVPARVPVV